MANEEHVALLKQGVAAWNTWRDANLDIYVDLRKADLIGANLREANLGKVNLSDANLKGANLKGANLSKADLTGAFLRGADLFEAELSKADLIKADLIEADLIRANLSGVNFSEANLNEAVLIGANLSDANFRGAGLFEADLEEANLSGANLSDANLREANLIKANLSGANLSGVDLTDADFRAANLSDANLREADLIFADLSGADLSRATLQGADLSAASLVEANLTNADLTSCCVYGVSAWELKLEGTKQQNLVITHGEPAITVDDIEVAQFVYLLLHNERIRGVIDTITSKAVLILGRFTDARKAVLDALREELRKHNYLPILFDFSVPATRDITETVSLLARMARFIIADLTDPSSIPKELEAIVPSLAVPVQPLLEGASRPYSMFKDYWKYEWVLPVYRYEGLEPLLATLAEKVIAPAEGKVRALEERRRMIEAELIKP